MFESAKAKLARADYHIAAVASILNEFLASVPYGIRRDGRYSRISYTLTLDSPLPEHVMLIAGDALHNLRTALDHCAWEMSAPCRSELLPDDLARIMFPFAKKAKSRAECDAFIDKKPHFPVAAKTLLKALEPFSSGSGAELLELHEADIDDKHEVTLPIASTVTLYGYYLLTSHYGENSNKDYNISKSYRLGYSPSGNITTSWGRHFGTANIGAFWHRGNGPVLKSDDNARIELTLVFGPGHLSGRPVADELSKLRNKVANVLQLAEQNGLGVEHTENYDWFSVINAGRIDI